MTNGDVQKTVSDVFARHAKLLDLAGASPFKVRAYENASRIVAQFEADLAEALASGELAKQKGIGSGILEKVRAILETGSFPEHDKLVSQTPAGLVEMLAIPGLGAKTNSNTPARRTGSSSFPASAPRPNRASFAASPSSSAASAASSSTRPGKKLRAFSPSSKPARGSNITHSPAAFGARARR